MLRRFAIAWVCIIAASVGTRAQTPIDVPSGDVWSHRWSTLKVPPKVAGFERARIVQYTTDEHNLAAMFTDEATSTSATLYVFKPGVDALPIWTDRAVIAMLSSGSLGTIDLDGVRMRAITPPGVGVVPSGYRVTASVAGDQASSTAWQFSRLMAGSSNFV